MIGESLRICLQIAKPEHKGLYDNEQQGGHPDDQVLCVEELKLKLLAKSSVCPGIITIIWSLITSDTEGEEETDPGFELDDALTELLNSQTVLESMHDPQKHPSRTNAAATLKQVKPVDIPVAEDDPSQD